MRSTSALSPNPAAGPLAANAGSSGTSTPSAAQPSSTFVFVQNAGAGAALQELRLNSDGSLVPVSGSPFAVAPQTLGLAGSYLIAGSAGQMATYQVDPQSGALTQVSSFVQGGSSVAGNESFVYAGGSNAIYGYALSDGQLKPLPGFPYGVVANPCDCATPIYGHLAVRQGYLFYSVDDNHGGSWFDVKKIAADGSLADLTNACGSYPGDVNAVSAISVAPNGKFIYEGSGAFPSLQLTSFDPNSGALSCSQYTTANQVFDSGVIDAGSRFLIAHQQSGAGTAAIGSYRIDSTTGQLTAAAAFAGSGQPQAIDPSGKYLLTIETPTASTFAIGVYAIDPSSGSLNLIGNYSLGADSASNFPVGIVVAQF